MKCVYLLASFLLLYYYKKKKISILFSSLIISDWGVPPISSFNYY